MILVLKDIALVDRGEKPVTSEVNQVEDNG